LTHKKTFRRAERAGVAAIDRGVICGKSCFCFFIENQYFHDFSSFQGLLEKVQFRMAERLGNASKNDVSRRARRAGTAAINCENVFAKMIFGKMLIENLGFT